MKRILAWCFLLIFSFSVLTACGNQKDPVEQPEDSDVPDNTETSAYRDFFEEEFRMLYLITSSHFPVFWPEPTTEINERTRTVSAEVEQLLNCKLSEDGRTSLNAAYWQAQFATGNTQYHWTESNTSTVPVYQFYKADFIQSWNDIPGIDLSDASKWGTPRNQANATINGELYVSLTDDGDGIFGCLLYNKILNDELAAQSPQALYEQNNWTWDTFESYLEDVTVKTPERTVYGLAVWANLDTARSMLPLCAVFSNGGSVVRFDEDGMPRFALGDAEALEALAWAEKITTSPNVVFDLSWPPDTWAKSGSVFVIGDANFGTKSSGSHPCWGLDNLDDIRFIPFPKGPKGDGSVGGAFVGTAQGFVMLSGIVKEDAGYVWNVRKDVEAKYAVDATEEWKRITFFGDDNNDEDSYLNYKLCIDTVQSDYSTQIGTATAAMRTALEEITHGTQTPAAGIESIETLINAALAESFAVR